MERIKNKLGLLLLIVLLSRGIANSGYSQNLDKYYALLTYKLTDYFAWPDDPAVKTIGVFGNSKVTAEMDRIITAKKEAGIKIMKITSLDQVAKCNIIFLPADQSGKFKQLLDQMGKQNIVLVTQKEGFAAKGAGISFVVKDNRLKMQMNQSAIESRNIKVSSSLLSVVDVI
jgi:hypothetical protein